MRIDKIKLVIEMTKKDLSGKQLSEISGVNAQIISKIKTGKSGCTLESAVKLARALNVTVEDLLEDDKKKSTCF